MSRRSQGSKLEEDRPPAVFRHFLYLDKEEVLNALSAIQGGAVEEAVDEIVRSREGNLGLSLAFGGQGIGLGGKSGREVKHGLRRRQTVHAAIAALLYALEEEIRRLPATTTPPTTVEENNLVQFDCEACYGSSQKIIDAYTKETKQFAERNFLFKLIDPRSRNEKEEADRAAGIGIRFVALASPADTGASGEKFVLRMQSEHLLVPVSDFSRRVTVVGQVVGKPRNDEKVLVESNLSGTSVRLASPESSSNCRSLEDADLRWSPEHRSVKDWDTAYLLRPLCIFK